MANVGTYPELEKKLFCAGCLAGAHGKVLSYNHTEILNGIEDGTFEESGLCRNCSTPLAVEAAPEPEVVEVAPEPTPEPAAPVPGRRTRTAEAAT